jgi:DNA mismatch endonuclease (patch repair protein)
MIARPIGVVRQQFKTTPARSRNMRAIRSSNNATTERKLRAHLVQLGIVGWKMRPPDLPGAPDFVFPGLRTVLFTDGCFWHGCPKCGHTPKSNVGYWKKKLERNKSRDMAINAELRSRGFTVVRIWECEVKQNPRKCLQPILVSAVGKRVRKAQNGLRTTSKSDLNRT